MNDRLDQLERRLAAAEREARASRRTARAMGGISLLSLVGMLTFGPALPGHTQGPGETVSAPFHVVDGQNHTLLSVEGTPDGGLMTLFDAAGQPIMTVSANGAGVTGPDGPTTGRGILVSDAAGKQVIHLGTSSLGRGLAVGDPQGRLTTQLGNSPLGMGVIVLNPADTDATRRFVDLGISDSLGTGLLLADNKARLNMSFGNVVGNPGVVIGDSKNAFGAVLGATTLGRGLVMGPLSTVPNQALRPTARLEVVKTTGSGLLTLLNKTGQVLFKKP